MPPVDPAEDLRFLARLAHRGQVTAEEAEALLPALQGGQATLDALLAERLGRDAEWIARMRRTNAGEIPEIPGYDIGERLGVGGTATVWRALEKKTRRAIALKVLKPEIAARPSELKAFVEEARLLERLEHPGLVRGFGVAKSGSTVFCRLECLPGRTLLELLDEGEAFDEGEGLRIVLEVARVLLYLEEQKIVHRDVKPGNVIYGDDGRVVLIDLGFAAESGTKAKQGAATGTVAYLSPEQAQGGAAADARSDIYSLGVSLFQLVLGRLPFDGDDRDVLRAQVMERLNSPELRGRGFSPYLAYFIEKMMAKDVDHRYQGWKELIEDIAENLAGREDLDFRRSAGGASPPPRRPRRR